MFDLIIIGASAAGVSASIYAKRRNLNFLLISKDIGGEVATSGEVENYLGFSHTDGIELTAKFKEQMAHNRITCEEVSVEKIEQEGVFFRVQGHKGQEEVTFQTKTVIIATGAHPRLLNVPGEKEFRNKGVSYCTTCDGPIFQDKVTATIGGGNSGLESSLMLEGIASKTFLIQHSEKLKGDNVLIEKATHSPKISVLYNAETVEIFGDTFVKGLKYKDKTTGQTHTIDAEGIFIHIGLIPNTNFIDLVEKDEAGYIKVNPRCQTNIPGIFAAGDVTDIPYKQISIAAGQGSTAALSAVEYLNKLQNYVKLTRKP